MLTSALMFFLAGKASRSSAPVFKSIMPIAGRLCPSHYSLIYYSKGKPKTLRKIRTPIELCRHCKGEVKDYGGHRNAMNPKGVNLMDVWNDIPPSVMRNSSQRNAKQMPFRRRSWIV